MKWARFMVLTGLALSACARATSPATAVAPTGSIQYEGTFRSIQQSDGSLRMNATFQANGRVQIIYRESSGRSIVNLLISTSTNISDILSWTVVPGRCGSGAVPVAPASQFPVLEFGNNSRAELTNLSMPIALAAGTYHVDVYRGGETLANVVACANLTMQR